MQRAFCFYVGVDWATQTHRVCLMDANGEILRQQSIEHSGGAANTWLQSLEELAPGNPQGVAVAIEVPRGPLVEASSSASIPSEFRNRMPATKERAGRT